MAHYTLIAYRADGWDRCGDTSSSDLEINHSDDVKDIIRQWARIQTDQYFLEKDNPHAPYSKWEFTLLCDGHDLLEIDPQVFEILRKEAKETYIVAREERLEKERREAQAKADAKAKAIAEQEQERKALQ
jgi:hypothetical protein